MDSGLVLYIDQVCLSIAKQDSKSFRDLVSITPQNNQGSIRAHFRVPLEFDLYPIPEKFRDIVKSYLSVMKNVYIESNIELSFIEINEMVNNILRAANTETNWINSTIMNSCTELINIYKVKQKTNPESETSESLEESEFLNATMETLPLIEKLVRTINKAFTVSLNDKNPVLAQSRRINIYFFLSKLIRLYFKMGKIELAKSVEKALKGTRSELPPLNWGTKSMSYSITYLYYSSLISMDDSDFIAAESKLSEALKLCNHCINLESINIQREKILMLLIPLKLYINGETPTTKSKIWENFPNLKLIYADSLIPAIKRGDLKFFEAFQRKFQVIFLKYNLYLLIENLKKICYYELIKKTANIVMNELDGNHIVPLSAFQVALDFSIYRAGPPSKKDDKWFGTHLDEVECILANLIFAGKVKGYISHANKCIVLSKTNAFP